VSADGCMSEADSRARNGLVQLQRFGRRNQTRGCASIRRSLGRPLRLRLPGGPQPPAGRGVCGPCLWRFDGSGSRISMQSGMPLTASSQVLFGKRRHGRQLRVAEALGAPAWSCCGTTNTDGIRFWRSTPAVAGTPEHRAHHGWLRGGGSCRGLLAAQQGSRRDGVRNHARLATELRAAFGGPAVSRSRPDRFGPSSSSAGVIPARLAARPLRSDRHGPWADAA